MTKPITHLFLTLFSFVLFLFTSCHYPDPTKEENERTMKKYFADFLSKTDMVEIKYFILTDTVSKILRDSNQINIFKEVINGKEDTELLCDTTGKLSYFKGDTLLLEAYFSTPGTESKLDKGVVTYFIKPDIYKTLFTYRAGMSIDEYFHEFKKQLNNTSKNNR